MRLRPEVEAQVLALAAGRGRAPKLTEAAFQTQLIALARALGWHCYHTHDSRRSTEGFPDLVLSKAQQLLVAELKVPPNAATAAQLDWLDRFRAARIPAFLWYPSQWPEIERTLRGE